MTHLNKIDYIRQHLNESVLEREQEIEDILGAVFSGQHVFLLGIPGTAKSFLIRKVIECFEGNFFQYLMTKTTKPDKIFGPISLSELKKDNLKHKVEGYFPTAHWAFFDEEWKSNSAVLNSKLTALEEGIFTNGNEVIDLPLRSMFCASNELPQEDILEALYDRIVVRLEVNRIQDVKNFIRMVEGRTKTELPEQTISLDELDQIQEQVEKVDGSEVIADYFDLQRAIDFHSKGRIFVSDRHLKKAWRFLKARVWMQGRNEIVGDDFMFLANALWSNPEDLTLITTALMEFMTETVSQSQQAYNELVAVIDTAMGSEDLNEFKELYAQVMDKGDRLERYVDEHEGSNMGPHLDEIKRKWKQAKSQIKSRYRQLRRGK